MLDEVFCVEWMTPVFFLSCLGVRWAEWKWNVSPWIFESSSYLPTTEPFVLAMDIVDLHQWEKKKTIKAKKMGFQMSTRVTMSQVEKLAFQFKIQYSPRAVHLSSRWCPRNSTRAGGPWSKSHLCPPGLFAYICSWFWQLGQAFQFRWTLKANCEW